MRVEPFEVYHLDLIDEREIYSDSRDFHKDHIKAMSESSNFYALTIFDGGLVASIVGLVSFWPGVAECWAITTEHIKKKPYTFHRLVLELLKDCENIFKLHRIQITVRTDYNMGMRWARALGFYPEGIMKKYMPDGTDHYICARVR